ncbi:MAG: hypothetical protein R3357_15570 [Burkholderiales bacterium]|nr:hypothetical protein [Burkholderiales bacterium]
MAREHVIASGAIGRRLIHWRAALLAGLAGGIAFLVLQPFLTLMVSGESFWAPLRMIAAILMGRGVLEAEGFGFGPLLAALLVHFALSLVYGVGFGLIVHRWHMGLWRWNTSLATAVGAVYGVALFALNFFAFTQLFPWFAEARSVVTLFTHIAFGAVVGVAYAKFAQAQREAQAPR